MKAFYLLLVGAAIFGSSQLSARDAAQALARQQCDQPSQGSQTEGIGLEDFEKVLSYTDKQYDKLSRRVCRQVEDYFSDPTNFPVDRNYCEFVPEFCKKNTENYNHRSMIRTEVAKRLGIKTKAQLDDELPTILNILSTYSCKRYKDPNFEQRPLNFMKVAAISDQFSSFYDNFIYKDYVKDGKLTIDLNAVEDVNGQPETLIDFFDQVISDKDYYKITRSQRRKFEIVRRTLREMGAKRYAELSVCNP